MNNKVEDVSCATAAEKDEEFFIHPNSITYQVWEGFVAVSCFLCSLAVSFQAAFKADLESLTAITYACDCVYLIHIAVKFFVAFIREGDLITSRKEIQRKYARKEFILDIVSVLPLELIFVAVKGNYVHGWQYVIRIGKLNRILRFYSTTAFFGKYEDQLGFNTKAIRSFKYVLVAYTLIHTISCGWYSFACPNEAEVKNHFHCYSHGWAVHKNQSMESLSTLQRYVKCLYWATITATTTGYGDIHAVNTSEKFYSVVSMLLGIGFFFGPILGYMASNLTNADSKRARYTHRIDVIKKHLKDKSVTMATRKKVTGYYDHLWTHHQGVVKHNMFSELPMTFQAEISMVLNKHILEKAPLFQDVSLEFMRMTSLVIKPVTYLPKQIIFMKNDIRHTLFYVKRGLVEVIDDEDNDVAVKVLKEGSFFGEVSLLLNLPRCATVRAATYCELLMLDRSDLMKVLKHFPEVSQQLNDAIEDRCQKAADYIKTKDVNTNENSAPHVIIKANVLSDNDTQKSQYGKINTLLFNDNSRFLLIWKIFVALVVIIHAFLHTYVTSFKTSFGNAGYGSSSTMKLLFGMLYVVDIIHFVDMFIKSRTTIEDKNQDIINDKKVLLQQYLHSGQFIVDVIAVFPLELLAFAFTGSYSRWIAATFLRGNRILKLYKPIGLIHEFETNIVYDIINIRIVKLAIFISASTHICACVWYFQACFGEECSPNSWAVHTGITGESNTLETYVLTLYWAAATMTSTGYGDVYATSSLGEFIVIFVTINGLLLYGYCLSTIAAILTNMMSPKVEFMGRINAVLSFMTEQKLSHNLIERVDRYLGLVWRIHRGEAIPGAQLLMGDIPNRLQQDVSFEELNEIICKVPIFMNTDISFIKQLSAKLITYVFIPGDMIVYSGDVGREMYIMRRGLVEVLSKDQSYVVATLGPGGYFGEVGLIFGESRTADVRAKTYCEVAMLRKNDLDQVLVNFPLIERQLQSTSDNKIVLQKIREAAKVAGAPRAVQRIDLIERSRKLRSKSVFRRISLSKHLSEEESNVNEELNLEFKAPYEKLHPILYYLSYLLLRTTFDPHDYFFRVWTGLTVATSCIYFFTLGLQVAFLQDQEILWIINYTFDVMFIIDMYIKLHVSYYNSEGVLVTHPTATAKNYLKTNFILDFIACAPADVIVLASGNKVAFGYTKLNRVLHMIRVVQYFNYLNEPISGHASLYRKIKFATYMILLTHLCACTWFLMGCPYRGEAKASSAANVLHGHDHSKQLQLGHLDSNNNTICNANSWAVENGRNLGREDFFYQYVTSIYWAAATTCSVGYGDIHAYLVNEMGVSLICMIVGVVFYGYVVASAAASLANADVQRSRYQQKLDTINRFLKEQNVTPSLEKRVKGFYEFLWSRNKGVDLENLFQGLPISLQADITLSLYKDIIESVPLFQGTELGFTKMLSLYIQPLLVPKGEYIVRKGDIGEEMFFINKGVVEVVSEHEVPIVFDTMSPGRFFGEISTIFSCPRTASIRAQTNADVFVLKKKDLDVVLSYYPQIRKQIIETAEERQNMVKQRALAAQAKKKEEEDRKKEESENQENNAASGSDLTEDIEQIDVESVPTPLQRCVELLRTKKKQIGEMMKFVIDTDSKARHIAEVNAFLIFVTFLTSTYMATFQHHPTFLIAFNLVAEVSFYVEIFLKFHMSFYTPTGEKITLLNEITKNYLHGQFRFDAVANFPLQVFCFASSTNRLKYYSYFNLLHVLRFKRLRDWFEDYLKKLNINVLLIRMVENLVQIFVSLQTLACVWYGIACPGAVCSEDSWVGDRENTEKYTHIDNYVECLYWALATMTSTGYGDIHATNNIEKVVAAVTMVTGKLVFGFVLGSVASTMANAEALRVKFEERFAAVQHHMKEQKMPLNLQARVVNFFEYIWRRNHGSSNEALFSNLPPCLHAELCLELTGDVMKNVPLFQGCELPFIRQLCTKAELIQFHKGELITCKGDIGHEMYFIKRGKVEVDQEHSSQILVEGGHFGDDSLVINVPRKNDTRAVTHVDMFCLRTVDLELTFSSYPAEEERVRRNAYEMY